MFKSIAERLSGRSSRLPDGPDRPYPPGFKGYVDKVTRRRASGWVYEKGHEHPVAVQARLGGQVLAECIADEPRPDVADAQSTSGSHGFTLNYEDVETASVPEIELHVRGQEQAGILPVSHEAYQRRSLRYQDFDNDGEGSSRSHEKLTAIRLKRLGKKNAKRPLEGMTVLDLGCNEGFFCMAALELGAERVVGVDRSRKAIRSARKRCPEAKFIRGSWWDLPQGPFDIVLFLSAIHYESEQKAFLQKLKSHIKPGGHLVLECGVVHEPGARAWHAVARGDGVFRYPTRDLLIYDLLSDYSVRSQGRSPKQAGDPVPRRVLHCSPKQATAIVITGRSGSGKSNLSFDLIKRDVPTYTTDTLLGRMVRGNRYAWSPIAKVLRKKFGSSKKRSLDLGMIGRYIVSKGLAGALADLVVDEVPVEAGLFSIQGEVLCHPEVHQPLVKKLEAAGVRVWLMQPAAEALGAP